MQFKDLAAICQGKLIQFSENRPIQTLLIDSRKAVVSDGSVFFAIPGDRHDGHHFVKELYHLGLRQFVVEKEIQLESIPDANVLLVDSAVAALQAVAIWHRNQFKLPVVGITGSNGKTIIKEWLFQVLSPDLQVVKNPGSYNSQVGVPLSVWQIQSHNDLGIFEAGISQVGEMEKLQAIIQPSIGIFANLGSAHDEGFGSREEKAAEKSKLFVGCEVVIYCKDHALIDETIQSKKIPSLSWGLHAFADINISPLGDKNFQVKHESLLFTVQLPFADAASQENAFHVMSFLLFRGMTPAFIVERMQSLRSIPMRLEIKQGVNRSILIDDSYNNDLAGIRISLDFLKNQQKVKKTLILSDVLQTGLADENLMKQLNDMLLESGVKRFIAIGPSFQSYRNLFESGTFYNSTSEFLKALQPDDFADEVVLIKGARPFQFEKIVRQLQKKVHGTTMEVDLQALVHNVNFFKSRLRPGTKLMAMVKAFAYGSGSEEVANLLQYHRIDYLGVAYADEGVELRKNNISLPIMVMNPSEESFPVLLEYRLEPEVYNLKILKALLQFLENRPCNIHLKLDTGMHRLGFEDHELEEAIDLLLQHQNVKVASVFSHLAGADESVHDGFSQQQAEGFMQMASRVEKALGYRPIRHLLNSPGALRLPEYQFDMVRLGIGLYGVDPTEEGSANLKPVATLKTVISQIKVVKAGETIGYGRRGVAERDMTVATLAIGYADGYSRSFSNGKGKVLVRGSLAPVVGNVCMDMTMVDITGIQAREGDEAIIFGPGLPIQQVAKWIETIPYELLTNTSERVKRVFLAESI